MTENIYDILLERGILAQATHPDKIRELLGKEPVTFYIGFDPTADSLHIGHFVQIMVMSHMQRAGHRPIAIMGGGTAKIGDPSGKSDMRKMMTDKVINKNIEGIKKQFSKLVDFTNERALMINNSDWLDHLNYIGFLRDIGIHFSVNKMLSAECFKSRYEKGLNFLEFNYMLMQAFDFYKLYKEYGCVLQLGGDDQWSNILAGIDLIRRKEGAETYGLTFNLLTTSEGVKMGKTEKGALWLDPEKTTPYEFFQYLRNIQDEDVINALKMLTFIDISEIKELAKLEGADINKAKEILAYEVTKIVHGQEEASKAKQVSRQLFEKNSVSENMPVFELPKDRLPIEMTELCVLCGLSASKSEAKRLIGQKGLFINDDLVESFDILLTDDMFINKGMAVLRKGKKTFLGVRMLL